MSGMGTYNKVKNRVTSKIQSSELFVLLTTQDLLLFTYLYVLYWYNFNQMVHLC